MWSALLGLPTSGGTASGSSPLRPRPSRSRLCLQYTSGKVKPHAAPSRFIRYCASVVDAAVTTEMLISHIGLSTQAKEGHLYG